MAHYRGRIFTSSDAEDFTALINTNHPKHPVAGCVEAAFQGCSTWKDYRKTARAWPVCDMCEESEEGVVQVEYYLSTVMWLFVPPT